MQNIEEKCSNLLNNVIYDTIMIHELEGEEKWFSLHSNMHIKICT